MHEAVLVQAPVSASVVPCAVVHVVDISVSGGIAAASVAGRTHTHTHIGIAAASVAGRVGQLAAVCRERVVVGLAGRRSSAGGAA